MSYHYRGRDSKGNDSRNLDDYFSDGLEDINGYYDLGNFYRPTITSASTYAIENKDAEIYFGDKIQKFILENIHNNLEWYIFGYGKKIVEDDLVTFHVEEYILPLQKRTSGDVKVDDTFKTIQHVEMKEKFPDLEYVGLIHSHHTMSAFFSKTDDEDIEDFKAMCPDAGFSIVFAIPKKKYTKFKDGALTLSSLRFDVKVWVSGKFTKGEMILCHGLVDLDYSTNKMLDDNDEEIVKAEIYKRVLKCRKVLGKYVETPHMDKLNRRQLESLLWATGMTEAERNNLAVVLRTGDWKEEGLEEEGDE